MDSRYVDSTCFILRLYEQIKNINMELHTAEKCFPLKKKKQHSGTYLSHCQVQHVCSILMKTFLITQQPFNSVLYPKADIFVSIVRVQRLFL